MNRLKLWIYMLLVLGAVAVLAAASAREGAERTLRAMDATLGAAADQAAADLRASSAEAAAVVELAGRDAGLLQALSSAATPPDAIKRTRLVRLRAKRVAAPVDDGARQGEVDRAARIAVERAAQALAVTLPEGAWSAAATRDGLARRASQAKGRQREAAVLLRDAAGGKLRRGVARADDALFLAAAAPAGEGAAIALFLPLDERWASRVAAAAGVDVTLAAELPRPVTTAPPREAQLAIAAALKPGKIADVGALPKIEPRLPRPWKLPPLPLLGVKAPELRAVAVGVAGAEKAAVVLSLAAAPRLEPVVRLQWLAAGLVAVALLAGLVAGLMLRGDAPVQIPEDLVAAAARMGDGDFSARAPAFAGRLGTISAGLNAAAEAAAAGQGRRAAPGGDPFSRPPAEMEPSAFELPPRAAAAPAPAAPAPPAPVVVNTSKLDAGALFGGPFEAAPVAAAQPAPAPKPVRAAAPPAAPAGGGEDAQWQEVFQEFLRVRSECGEPSEGLTYDKFRVKLVKNKDQLVQKYGCKTVKFQVYVKEGKAALKATPVR